ncbi:MAG: UTP--glucose-1-phosphate uridylyltransferase GalU [Firmicutes bacterium]|jgi:UTP--glucose-1-phosphate uridylyltransferase|nr:UTP--glucose-1-phosphate uridylyltransferase GalU [Bacillota bacterium]
MQPIRKAVIPAAGFGTRFLPATKAIPKEMLPIVDKPAIQYIIEEAVQSGIEELLIITGRGKGAVEDHFDSHPELEAHLKEKGQLDLLELASYPANLINIQYVRQKEARGLGHAISCARSFAGNEPFAVLLGDDVVVNPAYPCLRQLMDVYEERGGSVLGVQEVPMEDVSKYGIVSGDKIDDSLYKVTDLIEKPVPSEAPTNAAILGRYIITPAIFDILDHTAPGKGGEIQLTDGLGELALKEPMYAYTFEGKRYDIGSKLGFLQATVDFALARDDVGEEFRKYLRSVI